MTAGGLASPGLPCLAAQPDNTMAEGQLIRPVGIGIKLGFLAAANNASQSGTGTVYYTDGTTSTYTLNVGNFWYPAGQNGNPSNTQVAAVNYANYPIRLVRAHGLRLCASVPFERARRSRPWPSRRWAAWPATTRRCTCSRSGSVHDRLTRGPRPMMGR